MSPALETKFASHNKMRLLLIIGFLLATLSYWFFTPISHDLLAKKGQVASVFSYPTLLRMAHHYFFHLIASILCFFSALVTWILILKNQTARDIGLFLSSRFGVTVLIITIVSLQISMNYTDNIIDRSDAGVHISSSIETRNNFLLGEWPNYSFHYANGSMIGLQYPPLTLYILGILALLNPWNLEFNYFLLSSGTQTLLAVGLYRLLRVWKFDRLACALVALTMSGCHQMLVYNIASLNATYLAISICPWAIASLSRWLMHGELKKGLIFGYWTGLCILAHPVTALFLVYLMIPVTVFYLLKMDRVRIKAFAWQGFLSVSTACVVSLSYILSIYAFQRYNSFKAKDITTFVDRAPHLWSNFLWLLKYIFKSDPLNTGEFISILIMAFAICGFIFIIRNFILKNNTSIPEYPYSAIAALFFFAGGLLFYGRDTSLVSHIPAIKLTKAYVRLFIFFAVGISLLAVLPLHLLILKNRFKLVLLIALTLFVEQLPFWVRPTFRSQIDEVRPHVAEFPILEKTSTCFLLVHSPEMQTFGTDEEVLLRRAGYTAISPLYIEEQPRLGELVRYYRSELFQTQETSRFEYVIGQLKWWRVTHIAWMRALPKSIDLGVFGHLQPLSNGVLLELDGPTMQRGTRELRLQVVTEDIQGNSVIMLPLGYSPFLHCWQIDRPEQEIVLKPEAGYTVINQALPVGTKLIIKAITPCWLSLATGVSHLFIVGMGLYLLLPWRAKPRCV